MRVAVVGVGNVGCALLCPLAYHPGIEQVLVISRNQDSGMAAILDVASASPAGAAKMTFASYEKISEADIVVLTAGIQMHKGQSASDVLQPNIAIADLVLAAGSLKSTAIVICLATPVDYLTVHVQKKTGLPRNQVFGFGGDLDRNRLEYVLQSKGVQFSNAAIVGEHGGNAIPVYAGEADYATVAQGVRKFLSTITAYAGETRNLATGDLLGKLVASIVDDSRQTHYVCGHHSGHDVYLTWPFKIGRTGVMEADSLKLQGNASGDLDKLLSIRRSRIAAM